MCDSGVSKYLNTFVSVVFLIIFNCFVNEIVNNYKCLSFIIIGQLKIIDN